VYELLIMMRITLYLTKTFQFKFIFHKKQTFFDVSFPAVEVVVGIKIFFGAITFEEVISSKPFSWKGC